MCFSSVVSAKSILCSVKQVAFRDDASPDAEINPNNNTGPALAATNQTVTIATSSMDTRQEGSAASLASETHIADAIASGTSLAPFTATEDIASLPLPENVDSNVYDLAVAWLVDGTVAPTINALKRRFDADGRNVNTDQARAILSHAASEGYVGVSKKGKVS